MEHLTQQEITEYLNTEQIGFWKLEIEDGKPVRMYTDENMQSLIGAPEGMSPEESYAFLIGHIHPESRHIIDEFRADMLTGNTIAEFRYNHPVKGEICIRCSGKQVKGRAGCTTIMGYDEELADSVQLGNGRQRENQLVKQNRELVQEQSLTDSFHKNLMDMSACGIISYTLPERRVLYMNAEALRIYGAENEESAKAHMEELIKKTIYPDPATIAKLIKLRTEDGTVDYQCKVVNSRGYATTLLVRTEIYRTLKGERAVFTTFLDMSENETLKNEKNILDVLCMDYTSVYMCDLAADSLMLLNYNASSGREQAAAQLGTGKNVFSSRTKFFYDTYLVRKSAPDFLEKMNAEYLMKYLAEHERFVYRFRSKPTDSGHEHFEAAAVWLKSDEGFKIVLGFRYIDDILMEEEKQKKLLEDAVAEARSANAAKTEFLRSMSHDVRTPINGIMGMLNMIERHIGENDRVEECVEKAKAAPQQLLLLVSDVLDISKLESNDIKVDNQPFDLESVLMEQMSATEAYAAQHGVKVCGGRSESHIKHNYLIGSAPLLNRAIMNLSSNAVKYNHHGGTVTMTCTELPSDDKTALFRFVCTDTGIGMGEEFLKHAFEPYAQEGKDSNTSYSGTGLGLTLVHNIVDRLNGTIELESKENKGTKVTLTLPFTIDRDAQQKKDSSGQTIDLSGKKALLVEDNELNREVAIALLEEFDVKIEVARNGQEAVEMFAASSPGEYDFIFMDIMMPVMDGLEAAREIRKLDRKDAATIPILAVSANAFQDDVKRSLDAGMNAHLTKPLEIEKIKHALQELLDPNGKTA